MLKSQSIKAIIRPTQLAIQFRVWVLAIICLMAIWGSVYQIRGSASSDPVRWTLATTIDR